MIILAGLAALIAGALLSFAYHAVRDWQRTRAKDRAMRAAKKLGADLAVLIDLAIKDFDEKGKVSQEVTHKTKAVLKDWGN
jgi:uncharacterized protein YbjQ (UPF0145 family)